MANVFKSGWTKVKGVFTKTPKPPRVEPTVGGAASRPGPAPTGGTSNRAPPPNRNQPPSGTFKGIPINDGPVRGGAAAGAGPAGKAGPQQFKRAVGGNQTGVNPSSYWNKDVKGAPTTFGEKTHNTLFSSNTRAAMTVGGTAAAVGTGAYMLGKKKGRDY